MTSKPIKEKRIKNTLAKFQILKSKTKQFIYNIDKLVTNTINETKL